MLTKIDFELIGLKNRRKTSFFMTKIDGDRRFFDFTSGQTKGNSQFEQKTVQVVQNEPLFKHGYVNFHKR